MIIESTMRYHKISEDVIPYSINQSVFVFQDSSLTLLLNTEITLFSSPPDNEKLGTISSEAIVYFQGVQKSRHPFGENFVATNYRFS